MRKLIVVLAALAALMFVPAGGAVILDSDGSASAGGMHWTWSASYDTALNDLTFDCHLTSLDTGQPVDPTPGMIATVSITQSNGLKRTLDCVPIMNLGPQFDPNVNLKVDTVGRWSGYYITTSFKP